MASRRQRRSARQHSRPRRLAPPPVRRDVPRRNDPLVTLARILARAAAREVFALERLTTPAVRDDAKKDES